MIKKYFKILLAAFLITSQNLALAQTIIYYQNENPEPSTLFGFKYYELQLTAPAGAWFYVKGDVSLSLASQILTYENLPVVTSIPDFFNSTNAQITLFELSPGEYRTATTSSLPLNYFAIWTGNGTWDCILVSNSSTATCQSSPSAADTLLSLRLNALALRNAFNLQSAKIAQGLTYDCSVFDVNNICVSFVGTKSDGEDGLDNTTGALILAHKPTANFRFGGYVDQTFGTTDSGGLKVKRGSPGYGLFGVWSQNADGSGIEVRAAANYGTVDVETTRIPEVGSTAELERGFGTSDIKSNGLQLEISRSYALNSRWSARPYVGYRQTTNKRAAYTESSGAEFPLTYASLKQDTQSVLAGVRFAGLIAQGTVLSLSAGLEHDIKNDVDRYTATNPDIVDIDSIDMESGKKKTRPTVSLGLTHDIDKTQRIGFSVTHRKEAFESASTTSGMIQYSKGF